MWEWEGESIGGGEWGCRGFVREAAVKVDTPGFG